MAKKGQQYQKHDLDRTLRIVNEKINEGKSYTYLSEKYGVSTGTIKTWVYQFRKEGSLGTKKRGRIKRDENIDYKEKYEILKGFLEFLGEVDQEKK